MAVRMRMEQAVARAVAGAIDAGDAYTRALGAIAQGVDWPLAATWEPDGVDPDLLRCVATWAADEDGPRSFAQTTRATALRRGEGLPGRVWQTGSALWIEDAAKAAGLHAAVCFPVRSERGLVGVVEVFGPSPWEPDTEFMAALEVVGGQLGQLVERRRAEDSRHASE